MCYIIDVFFMDEHTLSKITKTYAKESPYQAGDFFVYILYIIRKGNNNMFLA